MYYDKYEKNGLKIEDSYVVGPLKMKGTIRNSTIVNSTFIGPVEIYNSVVTNCSITRSCIESSSLNGCVVNYSQIKYCTATNCRIIKSQVNTTLTSNIVINNQTVTKEPILQISGSYHNIVVFDEDNVVIGCCNYTLDKWLKNYKRIGKRHSYFDKEIIEYKNYLDFIKNYLETRYETFQTN